VYKDDVTNRIIRSTIHLRHNHSSNEINSIVHNPMNLRAATQCVRVLYTITKSMTLYKLSHVKLTVREIHSNF